MDFTLTCLFHIVVTLPCEGDFTLTCLFHTVVTLPCDGEFTLTCWFHTVETLRKETSATYMPIIKSKTPSIQCWGCFATWPTVYGHSRTTTERQLTCCQHNLVDYLTAECRDLARSDDWPCIRNAKLCLGYVKLIVDTLNEHLSYKNNAELQRADPSTKVTG